MGCTEFMANYEGESCAKCGKKFQASDDIVVCPDCGAPYHRACMKELEHCVYYEKHGTDEAYKTREERDSEQRKEQEKRADGRGQLRCSRCGTMNPVDGLFCEVCGTPLKKQVEDQEQWNSRNPGGQVPPFSGNGPFPGGFKEDGPSYRTIPYNPFTTPFGGLNADEEIDGVSVKELAIFLGQNSHYFLPKFKQMKERNSNTWNWSAFFFQHYYLLYRRMTLLGVLLFLVSMMFAIPSICINYDLIRQIYSPDSAPLFDQSILIPMNYAFGVLNIGIRAFLGMFANRLYMNQTFRKIKKIKAQYGETPEYHSMLLKNGSVSFKGVIIIVVAYTVVSFASVFIALLTMV